MLGNRETAMETLEELERALQNFYIVGNAELEKIVEELREALKEA